MLAFDAYSTNALSITCLGDAFKAQCNEKKKTKHS